MATNAQNQAATKIEPVVRVTEMDHIAVRVKDVDASLRFYHEILGLETDRLEEYREGKAPFPSVRLNDNTIIDLFLVDGMTGASIEPRNLDHYCIVVEPTDLNEVAAKLQDLGVALAPANPFKPEEVGGPFTPRYGAKGNGTSLYIYDPDENILELRYY